MRHRFFLLLLTALPVIGAAQRSKLPVYKKVDSLIKAGIDTILLFNETHIGAMPPEYDSCGINFSCLAWRQDNKVFYQKFSTSGLYLTSCYSEVIHHQLSIAFKIMDEYKETIVGEYLQPFIAKIELKDHTYYQILSTAHPTIYQLEFYWKNPNIYGDDEGGPYPAFTKRITTLDLMEKQHRDLINLNYTYNISTHLMQLINQIRAEIKDLEFNNRLKLTPQ